MVHSDFCLKAGKHLDENMHTADQYLSFEQTFKWKLMIFIHLIYTSSCYSSNSITMKRPSTDSFHPLPEKYIDLLSPIKVDHDYLHFNPGTTSGTDCNQWENRTLQTSSPTETLQLDYNGQNNISLSHTPLLPVSFLVEMIPYPRSYPGRSFFFSRLDNLNRIRLAIGLNQWGKTGESMELWIHHEFFYSLEPTPKISTYYIGSGLVNHAGLVIVPLPNYQFNTNKLITLIIEITNASVKVYKNCKLYHKPLFSINYRQNIKYHHLHGDRFENKSKELSRMDKFYTLSGGPYHGDKFLGLMKRMKMFFTEYGARKYCFDDSNFKLCKSSLNEQHIRTEWQKLNSFDQSNHTVQLNNNEQISGKINQQLNNNIYNRIKQSFNNNSDVTVKNRMKSNRCNQNIHEDNCTKLNLNKSVNNVPGGRPALTEVVGAEGDVSGDASTGTHSVSHMDRVDSGEENVLGTQVPGGRPALTEIVGAEGDVSGDASTGTHSVSHMDRVDSGEENVLGTQVPGGRPALTEIVGAEGDVSGDASTGTHSVSHMDRVDSGEENVLGTQVSSEQPASTSERQTGDNETRDTSGDSDSISHMGVGVGVGASEENLLDTQVSSEQPASTSERQTGDNETRDTSGDSDSISHMGVGVGVGASEENLLDTQVSSEQPASTSERQTGDNETRDTSGDSDSISHMGVGVGVGASEENLLDTQVSSEQPASTSERQTGDNETRDTSGDSDSISHMGVGVGVGASEENLLDTQVSSEQPASTSERQTGDNETRDTSGDSDSISHMGVGVGVGASEENLLDTQVSSEQPASTSERQTGDNETRDTSGDSDSISHMGVGVGVGASEENLLDTQVSSEQPASTSERQTGDNETRDTSGDSDSISHMGVGVGVGASEENLLDTQVSSEQPASTSERQTGDNETRDTSGDSDSISHMGVGVGVGASEENLLDTQVSSEQPASTSERQTGDNETRDTSGDSDSISHMGVGVGVGASEENLLDTQVSSEQPASTSERQTGDNETRDTSGDSDSISHMGVGVGVGASEENLLDTQMYKPTDEMDQTSDDLYVGLVKHKVEKQSHDRNATYITFEEVSGTYRMNRRADYNYTINSPFDEVIVHIGQKGDIGPQGPAGPVGSTGYCPETICPSIDMSSLKGVQGETGSSEWCNRSCKTIDGIIGLKGIKGLKGDMGDTLILSFSKALQLIKYTINITSSNYFPKGQKGDKGEVIQRKFIQRRISSQNNRNFHRRKRGQQQDYDQLTFRIHPLQENKQHVKHPLNQSTHDSSILFTGSNFANLEKQKILGVKILHNPNEFKTIGSILPVGALVVTEFFNYEVLSFANDNQSSKWDLNKNFQLDQLSSLGLFMKIENIHNTWKRIHVKFGQEVTFGQHDPNLQIYNSSSSKEPSSKTYTPRYREKIVFAFHPVPLTGGSFSGWHGANTKCHETALHHLGIPGFKVLLVDRNFPIERLIKWQYQHVPIINLGSQTVFSKWRDFLYGIRSNINVPLYDLYGMPDLQLHSKNFWLGGGITFGCDGWTTNSSTKFGLTWSFDHRIGQVKINYAKCDSINYLMCYKLVKSTLA
ncbi:unnamed protein product [Schistosoma haematobium]|nr:unnamed protein product [Schistosoma haematobium]